MHCAAMPGIVMTTTTMSLDDRELWRECVRWLVACGALDPGHRVTWPDSDVSELAQILRDGVLLCQLVSRIAPGSIEQRDLALRPQMSQFLCLKNICLFLGVCQNVFHLKQAELFEASELFRLSDFGKVLQTLSRFSSCDAARRLGVPSFPSRSSTLCSASTSASSGLSSYNDVIYRNLEEKFGDLDLDENLYDAGQNNDADNYGQIYDTIVHWTKISSKPREVDKWASFVPVHKRDFCVKELLDTEMNYVEKALEIIVNKYYTPLKSQMQPEDHETIFMNIVELYSIHRSFHYELRRAVLVTVGLEEANAIETSKSVQIGEVFLTWKNKFVAYGHYCSQLPASRARIEHFDKENTTIRQAIRACSVEANSCLEANRNQFLLQDLLTVPMQRILKYHVLLSEMIKLTSIESDDRILLEAAREAMQDINYYINEVKRDYEMKQVVAEIQKSIVDLDMPENVTLLDYGKLVKDGELKIADHSSKDGGKLKNRYVFIFDKVMLVCKNVRGNQYAYKSAHVLAEYRVDGDSENNNRFGTIGRKLQNNHLAFALVHENHANVLNMCAKTIQQKDAWVQHLEMANDNVKPKTAEGSGHKLRLFTFDTATSCTHCQKLLAGIFHQGYYCEVCECALHKACIAMRRCSGRPPRRKKSSFSAMSVSGSGAFGASRTTSRSSISLAGTFAIGEWVTAVQSHSSNDSKFLSFEKEDVIEVVEIYGDGTIKGRIQREGSRGGTGLVPVEYLRKLRMSVVSSPQQLSGRPRRSSALEQCVLPQVRHRDSQSSLRSITDGTFDNGDMQSSSPGGRSYSPPCDRPGLPSRGTSYENTDVIGQPWYMGAIDRDVAHRRLLGTSDGTFLVRYSANVRRYAVSVSFDGEVKHAKVEQAQEKFFLDESQLFDSVVELVNYYREHNLRECFETLNTKLREPLRGCTMFRVVHNYDGLEAKYLSMKKDEVVTLIDTQGEHLGWWRGRIDDRVGFFPISYVEPVDSSPSR